MVDATVSMVLQRLAPMIEKRVRQEVCLLINSNDDANNLSSKLKRIHDVLRDAERKGVADPRVKGWLDKLQEISYEIDDVLDEWDWKNLKMQSEELESASEVSSSDPWVKVSSFLESICLCFKRAVELRDIRLNIKELNEKLDSIGKENEDEFKFIPNVSPNSQDFKRDPTASFVDEGEVHGRHDDKEILVEKLLSASSSQTENGVQVIPIVGAGGVGKTTLAQLVFNDDRVKDHFKVKMWVCVSHPFDEIKVVKAILEALNKNSPNLSEFETLLQCVADDISGKNFLLVLDDVWTEDDTKWKPLKLALRNGASSSRIILTTRKTKVAEMMGCNEMQIQSLNPLSDSYCWLVLSQRAFHGRDTWDCEILKETGLEIVKKCKGLPLAAKTIGSLLHSKPSLEEWRKVLESQVWELEIAGTDIFPSLVLSYDELHPSVKRCFSYCAIFPKDTEIEVDMLIRIWCAQGFLSLDGNSDDMELRGREFFYDLAMRSFFQNFEREDIGNRIISCKMHDIVHDFAQFLTKNECLVLANDDARLANNQGARHLTLLVDEGKTNANPVPINQEKCRSFLSRNYAIPPESLARLKRVRVLILDECDLKDIPGEIGNLIHLRYLDLSNNPIMELPEDICDLFNLQTLKLEECDSLSRLPQGIRKLRNLRHLLNRLVSSGFEFPEGIQELTNLWTLNEISATKKNGKMLAFLRNLNKLHGSLRIFVVRVDDADGLVAAEKAELKNKIFIRELKLHYIGKIHFQIMEALEPHPNLEILHFTGLYLPKWLTTLRNLRQLTIVGDDDEFALYPQMGGFSSLPPLGKLLPFLEVLSLQAMPGMELLSREFLGIDQSTKSYAFPRLKRLSFVLCNKWREWEDISEEEDNNTIISVLPCLEQLEFTDCPELKALPHRLLRKASSLKYLRMRYCNYLYQRYISWSAEDRDKISHIPHVVDF